MKNLFLSLLVAGLIAFAGCGKAPDATADCPNTSCQNNGTVTLTDTICSCACGSGYTGDSCQYPALGNYNALRINTANSSSDNVVVTYTAVPAGLSIGIAGVNLIGNFTASNTFGVGTQTVGGVVYTGSGTFTPNNVSMNLTQGGVLYRYNGQK